MHEVGVRTSHREGCVRVTACAEGRGRGARVGQEEMGYTAARLGAVCKNQKKEVQSVWHGERQQARHEVQ